MALSTHLQSISKFSSAKCSLSSFLVYQLLVYLAAAFSSLFPHAGHVLMLGMSCPRTLFRQDLYRCVLATALLHLPSNIALPTALSAAAESYQVLSGAE